MINHALDMTAWNGCCEGTSKQKNHVVGQSSKIMKVMTLI